MGHATKTNAEFDFDWNLELKSIRTALTAELHEAVVLYCARLLEGAVLEAVLQAGEPPLPTVFENLVLLNQEGYTGHFERTCFHALRQMGNDARHLRRKMTSDDAMIALCFADMVATWCDDHLNTMRKNKYDTRIPECRSSDAGHVLRWLQKTYAGKASRVMTYYTTNKEKVFDKSPVYSSLLVEHLIRKEEPEDAEVVLESALEHFRKDIRLNQLKGWLLRGKSLEISRKHLEELQKRSSTDPETLGLLAGTYKRLWEQEWTADSKPTRYLDKSLKKYKTAWKASQKKNIYAGLNTASMMFLLGDEKDSRLIAQEVSSLLAKRITRVGVENLDFWNRATRAEVEILLGNLEEARLLYVDLFTENLEPKSEESTRRQLGYLLDKMQLEQDLESFLKTPRRYDPAPIDVTDVKFPKCITEDLIHELSRNNHDVWARKRMDEHWTFGTRRNDNTKEHPDLLPYELLVDQERDYDRASVIQTLKALLKLGYTVSKKKPQ